MPLSAEGRRRLSEAAKARWRSKSAADKEIIRQRLRSAGQLRRSLVVAPRVARSVARGGGARKQRPAGGNGRSEAGKRLWLAKSEAEKDVVRERLRKGRITAMLKKGAAMGGYSKKGKWSGRSFAPSRLPPEAPAVHSEMQSLYYGGLMNEFNRREAGASHPRPAVGIEDRAGAAEGRRVRPRVEGDELVMSLERPV